jgi:hypothetical protein
MTFYVEMKAPKVLLEGTVGSNNRAAGLEDSLAKRPTTAKKWDLRIGQTILSGSNSARTVVATYLLRS